MKMLLILRHAKSSWNNANQADFERPLNKRGKFDAPRMGRLLRREEIVPALIISSAAERALQTAEAVALAAEYEAEIDVTRDFYLAGPEAYVDRLTAVPEPVARVMVVGHNPGMAELVEPFTGAYERMPTATLAQIALPIDRWADLSDGTVGRLLNLWQPRDLID